jgi:ubiquinone/menaquinone biosynthesis C-methylase UbiE
MNIQERILLSLSRAPESKDYGLENDSGGGEWTSGNSLSLLEGEYPHFGRLVSGKRVVDFGCGTGSQSIALAKKYNCSVVGIDANRKTLDKAIEQAKPYNIPQPGLSFVDKVSDGMLNSFDIVISQNSFEHFGNPSMILDLMQQLLNDSGKLLVTFGPPWLAPYGSHMQFFCKVPWINVLFSEETVMKVRGRFRSDGATKYEEVESGLNRMTIAKFERIIRSSNLKIEYKSYKCIRGINVLSKIPLLREYFVNHVTVILSRVR